jgi:hypothetical protein
MLLHALLVIARSATCFIQRKHHSRDPNGLGNQAGLEKGVSHALLVGHGG